MNYCFSSFVSIRNNDFGSDSFRVITWFTPSLLVESPVSFDWNTYSYFFSHSRSSVVVMLFIPYFVWSIQFILRMTSQFRFVIQYVSLVSSFVIWSSLYIICFRVLVFPFFNLSSLKFVFLVFNLFSRIHFLLKNVFVTPVSISSLSITVLSV